MRLIRRLFGVVYLFGVVFRSSTSTWDRYWVAIERWGAGILTKQFCGSNRIPKVNITKSFV